MIDNILVGFFDAQFWIRIALSFTCGTIVGIERQIRRKPVGIRTASLICLGSMSFIYIGTLATLETPQEISRILAQLITGIGFIGGGVMMARNGLVNGVTSAATIWILAAIGAAIGLGMFGQALALSVTTVLVLAGFEYIESGAMRLRARMRHKRKAEFLQLEDRQK